MNFNGLQLEYALKGSSNYISWKDRMEAVLKDNGLKEFIDKDVPNPICTNATLLDAWQKKVENVRKILLEGVRDHIVSNLHGKLGLKYKLRMIKMEKGNNIPKYLKKFVQCRDELGSVGIIVVDDDKVSLALLGLLKS